MHINKILKQKTLGVFSLFSKSSKKGFIDSKGYVVTYVYSIDQEFEPTRVKVKFGYAIKNPEDVNISRIAKTIANRRYENSPLEFIVDKSIFNDLSFILGVLKLTIDNLKNTYSNIEKNKQAIELLYFLHNQFNATNEEFKLFIDSLSQVKNA